MGKKGKKQGNFADKGSAFSHSGVNLFAQFSSSEVGNALRYNPACSYSQQDFLDLKNLFQKCFKKSDHTKIKALGAILDMFRQREEKSLFVDQLPNWVALFCRLMKFEADKQVRISAIEVQRAFLRSFKKEFVTYIPDLFVPMWNSMYDPSIEVSSLAREVFYEIFPEDRHTRILKMCQETYVREMKAGFCANERTVSDEDLSTQAKQDLLDRLLSSSLLGLVGLLGLNTRSEDKDTFLLLISDLVQPGEYQGPKIWEFLDVQRFRNKVRSAALEAVAGFMQHTNLLDVEKLRIVVPLVFGKLADQDRFVAQALWRVAIPRILDHPPPCLELADTKLAAKELLQCVRSGGYGAGAALYASLLKLYSQIDPGVLSHTYMKDLFAAFLQGLQNDDSKTYAHALIMAYYEVFLLLYIKKPNDREWAKQVALAPVELFMRTEDTSSLHSIPSAFSKSLLYLDTKSIPFEIWDQLYSLLQTFLLKQLRPASVEFLDLVSSKTLSSVFSQSRQLEDLIENAYGVFSHDISESLSSAKPLAEALPALRLYQTFSSRLGKILSYQPHLVDWWTSVTGKMRPEDSSMLSILSSILQQHPEQWFEVVDTLGTPAQGHYLLRLKALIPEVGNPELVQICTAESFQQIPMSVIAELQNMSQDSSVEQTGGVILALLRSGLLLEATITKLEARLQSFVTERAAGPNYLNVKVILECAKVLTTRNNPISIEILSNLMVNCLGKVDGKTAGLVDELWKVIGSSCIRTQAADLMAILFKSTLHLYKGPTDPNHLTICRHLLELSESKFTVLETILLDESFFNRSFEEEFVWTIFDEVAVGQKLQLQTIIYSQESVLKYPWLLADLLAVEFCPSLQLLFELKHRLVAYKEQATAAVLSYILSQHKVSDLRQVLAVLIQKAVRRQEYSIVLCKTLQIAVEGSQLIESHLNIEEAGEVFVELVAFISETAGAEVALIEVAKLFKTKLYGTPAFSAQLEKWRLSATDSPQKLAIYGSALPETLAPLDEGDLALLSLPVTRGFHPYDFLYALAFSRRYGFQSFSDLLQVYEQEALLVISSEDQESLLTVLPFIQRILGSPELINDQRSLSNGIVALAQRFATCRSEQVMLEIAEVIARMHSIADEQLDEDGLFDVLDRCYHEAVLRAVYHLLQFAYQNCILTRVRSESPAGNPIPTSALKLLERIPEVRTESEMHIDPQVLGFILGWLLVLSKYQTEKFHLEKRQEASDSDFTVCVKSLLEGREELVTVFLTSLFAFFPDHVANASLLKPELAIGLVDLFDEDSCAQLACFALYNFLKTFPALARNWWNHSEKRLSALVLKFVTKVLSTHMYNSEIENIENRRVEWQCPELELRTSRAGRDITAHYEKEEVRVEIELRPPESYPLQPVNLAIRTLVKLSEAKIRGWELRLNKLFNNENASVLEAILMWKTNVDRELEGLEHCTICYYIVHVSDRSLPTMACKVCKNKFHAACIRKWFQTSNKNNCPLCQNHFWG